MKTVQLFAVGALLLSGVAFTGCDKKPETTPPTTTSPIPSADGVKATTESATDKIKDAATTAGDKMESGAKKAESAADNALKDLKK